MCKIFFYLFFLTCLLISPAVSFKPLPVSIKADFEFGDGDGTFNYGEPMQIQYKVTNQSASTVKGFVAGSISNLQSKVVHSFEKYVEIAPKESKIVGFKYKPTLAGVYRVFTRMRNSSGNLAANSILMGYALEKINSPISRKPDFYQFWHQSIQKLKTIPPNFKTTRKSQLSNNLYDVYLVEMKSLDNYTIRGWYRVPKNKKNLAVVLQLPSLGGSFYNIRSLKEKPRHGVPYDFAVLSLNIRGHGNSKDNINVGDNYHRLISKGIQSKEEYIYRGSVMDCIRALDFLYTRPEINKSKIAVEGGSQGGALSLMVAALDKRVRLCAPDVPFLSDIDNLIKHASWVNKEFLRYQRAYKDLSIWRMKYNLTYFDTKNFADKIKVPVLMGFGLQDGTCPVITSIVTYNKITSPKQYYIYPKAKHEGGGALHRKRKFMWMRRYFGM